MTNIWREIRWAYQRFKRTFAGRAFLEGVWFLLGVLSALVAIGLIADLVAWIWQVFQ